MKLGFLEKADVTMTTLDKAVKIIALAAASKLLNWGLLSNPFIKVDYQLKRSWPYIEVLEMRLNISQIEFCGAFFLMMFGK